MQVAVMGFGTVGSGVVELILKNKKSIEERCGQKSLDVKHILDIRDFSSHQLANLFTKDFNDILNDKDVEIVVETMGGLNPAFDFVSKCLEAGKSVVTSNKELVAAKGYELLELAKKNNVNFLFEASVGGGIPIIRPINQCLAANEFLEVAGILNGTTNFILTKMIDDGMDFDEALKIAQANGYAERDPSADILGHDAARKICILASLCFGKHVYPDEVQTEGITNIASQDVEYAKVWGGVIKLIGRAKKLSSGKISATVGPCLIKNGCQLASVSDVFNAILVRGDAVGDTVFYGRGAGKFPTASAVVADVIDCAKHTDKRKLIGWDDAENDYVINPFEQSSSLYIRAAVTDYNMVAEKVKALFNDVQILESDNKNEIAFVTPLMCEKDARTKIESLGLEIKNILRVLDY
ncbi:MAG: homoserine dehydrogenase [Clostridia bacterium]|nr:homoserine dehydrogenase [Clostridia bacterium]MBR3810471.1 homoserine dehydrogenase [Clostridia bacterium]